MSDPKARLAVTMPSASIELALGAAIDERLAAARVRLNKAPSQQFPQAVDVDPEESLRVFMIRLWPRVATGRATDEDTSQFYETLEKLWRPAHSADLRFLDAWNNAYEAAADAFPQMFIAAYVELLEAHASRLHGESRRGA